MTGPAARLKELRVALMLLTRLPAGRVSEPVPDLGRVRWAYPVIGLPVGLIGWAVHAGAMALGAGPALAGVAALAALALVTGGLHHDGLADVADGFGGGRNREHCLEIMRDSRIGSYGALALVVTLGLWAASVAQLGATAGLAAFVAVSVLSRLSMVVLLDRLPPARDDGLGAEAAGRDPRALGLGIAISIVCLLPLGLAALPLVLGMSVATGVVAWRAQRRIGGQTGDVLGAVQLLSETAGWAALAMWLG